MTANCIHLFRWPWRVARWSADARIRDTDTRRPTFPSFTVHNHQPTPLHPPNEPATTIDRVLRLPMVSLFLLPLSRTTPPGYYLHTFPLPPPRFRGCHASFVFMREDETMARLCALLRVFVCLFFQLRR